MLAIATAVAAATPTIPIMRNGKRAMTWRNGPLAFAGRLPAGTCFLAVACVEVGGRAAVTADGLAAASTGMTVAATGVGWAGAGTVVAAGDLLVCGAAAGADALVEAGAAVVPAGLVPAGAATEGLFVGDATALAGLGTTEAAVEAGSLTVGNVAALAGLDPTEAAVKAGGLTVGNVAAPAGLEATEAFGEPADLAVGRAAAALAEPVAGGITVGFVAAAIVAGGGHGAVAFASVGPNDATNDAAISRVAFASANASSAALDNNCMSSGLSTISIVSSSRLS